MSPASVLVRTGIDRNATEWMDQAACRGARGFTERDSYDQRDVCWNRCPVRSECADFGVELASRHRAGFEQAGACFGGWTPGQILVMVAARVEKAPAHYLEVTHGHNHD